MVLDGGSSRCVRVRTGSRTSSSFVTAAGAITLFRGRETTKGGGGG